MFGSVNSIETIAFIGLFLSSIATEKIILCPNIASENVAFVNKWPS